MKKILALLILFSFYACTSSNSEDDPSPSLNQPITNELYFPPTSSNEWATISPQELGWSDTEVQALINYAQSTNSRALLVLKNGRIVIEEYFDLDFQERPFSTRSNWPWFSAGKSLTAFVVGIALADDLFDLTDPVSDYLGKGWTSLEPAQEEQIQIIHLLSMTSGLSAEDLNCREPACLQYLAPPGTRWNYHTGAYIRLQDVVAAAAKMSFNEYFKNKIKDKIGLDGEWIISGQNTIYFSPARGMARFGLLMLHEGKWQDEVILNDANYFNQMITPSQNLNQAYGYLWWLNGQSSFMVPRLQTVFNGPMINLAPSDLYAAMGANGQIINVLPEQGLLIIRMGDEPNDRSLVSINYQNELWQRIAPLID